jgi:hypothetical protein
MCFERQRRGATIEGQMRACVEERAESLARVVESRLSRGRIHVRYEAGFCVRLCATAIIRVDSVFVFDEPNPNGEARSMLKGRADARGPTPQDPSCGTSCLGRTLGRGSTAVHPVDARRAMLPCTCAVDCALQPQAQLQAAAAA